MLNFIMDLLVVDGHNSVLVVVNQLTKMACFIACAKTVDTGCTADLFLIEVVWLHGLPTDMVVSDSGLQFASCF